MKAIWKILIGAAAVAAVAPYKVEKDEETGAVKLTSATWSATYTKDENGRNVDVKLLPVLNRKYEESCEDEECCCCGEETETDEGITVEEPETPAEPETPETPEADA